MEELRQKDVNKEKISECITELNHYAESANNYLSPVEFEEKMLLNEMSA